MISKVYFFIILFFCSIEIISFSQNLISNAGFEYFSGCPCNWQSTDSSCRMDGRVVDEMYKAVGWGRANRATPDYWHSCSHYGVPENTMGYQMPFEGNGYVGILVDGSWKEYIIGTLIEPLIKGQEYTVSMYVSLGKTCEFAISELGFCFTKDQKFYPITTTITDIHPQVVNNKSKYLDKTDWTLIEEKYTASGGEKYVVIGNFNEHADTKRVSVKAKIFGDTPTAYYYIDNVSTVPVPPKKKKTENNLVVLNNICFEYDKANLLLASNKELDKLIKLLKENNKMKIEVMGHTDSDGSYDYNMNLSDKRAKAVTEYIVKSGIKPERVSYKGYGDTRPLIKNETAQDKKLNRRVEVKIIK